VGSEREIQRQRVRRLIKEVVFPHLCPATAPLDISAHFVRGEPIDSAEAYARDFEPFSLGQAWGGAWSTAWFRFAGTVPSDWSGEHVEARIGLGYNGMVGFGGEGLLWAGDNPVQGINPRHDSVTIASPATGGEPVELYLEAAANPYVPWGGIEWPLLLPDYEGAPLYRLLRAELAVKDCELEAAWNDLRVLTELADALGPDDRRSAEIIRTLDRIALAVDYGAVRESLLPQHDTWAALLDSPAPDRSHLVTAVGHAHIDSAWLWPLRETRRKCARTFSSALALMEDNPDFIFVCSQAQQHAWMEQHYPKLFSRMTEKVAEGRFEPVGSMWVEPDTNMPSGESLVRQLVYGKRFFLDHYGVETEDCWLPDAFGYSANLPQILQSAGVRFFLTQKLSWNELDRFPHHTFWWEGIDGSRVLAHCPPTDTYSGEFRVAQMLKGLKEFAQHGVSRRSLYAYGYGDGGGGPTQVMLDSYRRLRNLDPLPKVELGTAKGFFRAVELDALSAEAAIEAARPGTVATTHAAGMGGLPMWVGELYLERHRGVQTTQAQAKLGNRRSEDLLREAELWAVAGLAADYPQDELERAWQLVLLHQFHDILTGSSIHWVHEESQADYAAVREIAGDVIERACAGIAGRVAGGRDGRSVLVFNAGSHTSSDLVEVDLPALRDAGPLVAIPAGGGEPTPVQAMSGGTFGIVASVPGSGWRKYDFAPADPAAAAGAGTPVASIELVVRSDGGADVVLSNGLLTARIGPEGLLDSLIDATTGREAMAAGASGNVFQLHLDLPNDADAWDVDQGTFDRATELRDVDSIEILERGPVRVSVRVVRSFSKSRISQEIRLVAGKDRLEFVTDVDWGERHRFLKVAFPVAVRSSVASYEVQFGYLQRPTHANTTWDAARFEVPAQRWADLSEPGFGVALLNDCKYGYDIRGSVMRLSLLRAPTWPDPAADAGPHRFSYAVMAHRGLAATLGAAGSVIEAAESFNLRLRAVAAPPGEGDLAPVASVLDVDGAMVSSVKRADRGDEVVVRLWESAGAHRSASLSVGSGCGLPPIAKATQTDALERDLAPLPPSGGKVAMSLRPFELVTLKLQGPSPQPSCRSSETESPSTSTNEE